MGFKETYRDFTLLMLDYISKANLQMAIITLSNWGLMSKSMKKELLYIVENKEELKNV